MNDRQLSLLGLARRAGKLAVGMEAAAEAIRQGEAALIVLARDISKRTEREIRQIAGESQAGILTLPAEMDRIGAAIGKRAGVIAVKDEGFARKITALQEGQEPLSKTE